MSAEDICIAVCEHLNRLCADVSRDTYLDVLELVAEEIVIIQDAEGK